MVLNHLWTSVGLCPEITYCFRGGKYYSLNYCYLKNYYSSACFPSLSENRERQCGKAVVTYNLYWKPICNSLIMGLRSWEFLPHKCPITSDWLTWPMKLTCTLLQMSDQLAAQDFRGWSLCRVLQCKSSSHWGLPFWTEWFIVASWCEVSLSFIILYKIWKL